MAELGLKKGAQGRTAAHLHQPAELSLASGQTPSRTSPQGDVSSVSSCDETSGQTQNTLEILHLASGLGMLHLEGAGECD